MPIWGFRMCVVGVAPSGRYHRPFQRSSAVFSWAPASRNPKFAVGDAERVRAEILQHCANLLIGETTAFDAVEWLRFLGIGDELQRAGTIAADRRQQAIGIRARSARAFGNTPTYGVIVWKQVLEDRDHRRADEALLPQRQRQRYRNGVVPCEPRRIVLEFDGPRRVPPKLPDMPTIQENIQRNPWFGAGPLEDILDVSKLAFGAFTHDKLEIEGRQGVQEGLKPCRPGAFLERGNRCLTHIHQLPKTTLKSGRATSGPCESRSRVVRRCVRLCQPSRQYTR